MDRDPNLKLDRRVAIRDCALMSSLAAAAILVAGMVTQESQRTCAQHSAELNVDGFAPPIELTEAATVVIQVEDMSERARVVTAHPAETFDPQDVQLSRISDWSEVHDGKTSSELQLGNGELIVVNTSLSDNSVQVREYC